MDAKITNSNENKANPVNYSTQGFTGDPKILDKFDWMKPRSYDERKEEHNSTVYAYVDENEKVAYVGLTIDKIVERKVINMVLIVR